jgi:hypothetical protein
MPGPKAVFMKVPEPSHAERIDVRNLKSRDEIDRFTDVPFTMVSADGHAMPPYVGPLPKSDYLTSPALQHRRSAHRSSHYCNRAAPTVTARVRRADKVVATLPQRWAGGVR